MDIETKLSLVTRSPTEEVITKDELRALFETKSHPTHYIGYEISGLLHLGSLFVAGNKLKDLLEAGVDCTVFLADWHSLLNNKLGGDWEKIQLGAKYFEEAFRLYAGDSKRLSFVTGSALYHNNDGYWMKVMRIAKASTIARTKRCLTIMGRKETESLDTAQFIYPAMQAADILELGVDIAHAGMDQRKIHMLLRDIADKINAKAPAALHHHLLAGLLEPKPMGLDEDIATDLKISSKMSKSNPDSCITIHDADDEIKRKIKNAWCPKEAKNNPVLELAEHIALREGPMKVGRPAKFGGDIEFQTYPELEAAYISGKLHPLDLKNSVAEGISKQVAPLRAYFEKHKELLKPFETNKASPDI